ncbi:MAG: hypothetical protein WBL95_16030 [Microcoleus sp.]
MISTQPFDPSGCDRINRSQQNPDLFLGDSVPGYQSFIPDEAGFKQSGIRNKLALDRLSGILTDAAT